MDPVTMMLIGAGVGAGGAALTGGDIGRGAMFGGLGGLAGGWLGGAAMGGSTAFGLSRAGLMTAAGAGVFGAMGAGGGSSTGFAPMTQIPLTPAGKKLETGLYESIKDDIFPQNLADRYIGKAKKTEQARQKISAKLFNRAAGAEVTSGATAKAIVGEMSSRMTGAGEGVRQVGEARRSFAGNRLTAMQNFMNIQTQTPLLRAQAALVSAEQSQARGAQQGAALGSMAQMLAMSAWPIGGRN